MNIGVLKNYSRIRKYQKGAVLAKPGGKETIIVVLKGDTAVCPEQARAGDTGSTVGFGIPGETKLFLNEGMAGKLVALTDVYALSVAAEDALSFIREEPEFVYELLKAMCARPGPEASQCPQTGPNELPHPPEPQQDNSAQIKSFALFPAGHGSYRLPMDNESSCLLVRNYTCPVCKREFRQRKVRASRLAVERTDMDLRIRYRGVEPLYYDVTTCPHCLYSALTEMFNNPDKGGAEFIQELQALAGGLSVAAGEDSDAGLVFAGYYLALYCAPKFFLSHEVAEAKLLLKLSRVYQDCGDEALELATARRALDAYLALYLNGEGDPAQDQQLCVVLGELYLKLKDRKQARDYFFKAKTIKGGAPLLKTHAENRLADLREPGGS